MALAEKPALPRRKRDKTTRIVTVLAVAFLTKMGALGEASQPILVDSDLQGSHWTTAFTNAVPLAWNWSADTTRVELGITGMSGSFATNFTAVTSNYLWQAFASDVPAAEDVYTLTLTRYTNGNTVAEVLTSRLAVVRGAFGETAVNSVSNSPAWSKVKGNVVLPYDAAFAEGAANAATAQLVIKKENGRVETNTFTEVAGYAGWQLVNSDWGYGTFDLALTFPGTAAGTLTAELTRSMGGTMVKLW